MKTKQVINILNSLNNPFSDRLDLNVCDKFGNLINTNNNPILRFRGLEHGKLISLIFNKSF